MRGSRRVGCAAILALPLLAAAALAWLLPHAALVAGPSPQDPRLVRGSLHVHTVRSDGAGTVDDVARAAARAGLDFVVLTDHGDATQTPDRPAYRHGVLCIDAVEISTTGGHYVALGLGRAPYRLAGEPRDVVEDVARLGGFGIVAHPASPKPELAWTAWGSGIDGLEWLNADSAWRDERPADLARALATYFLRAPETIAAMFSRDRSVFDVWDRLTQERRVVAVAGHDAHARIGLGGNWEPEEQDVMLRLPGYESAFRAFAVRVRLDAPPSRDADRDAAGVIAALRAGHAVTIIDAFARNGGLRVEARGEYGTAGPGDELPADGPVQIDAQATAVSGLRLTLIRDGRVAATSEGPVLRFVHPGGLARAVYRVEASLDGRGVSGLPWIVANPIYLGPPAERLESRSLAVAAAEPVPAVAGEWTIEREPRSEGRLETGGAALRLTWHLAAGVPSGQYVAAAHHFVRGHLAASDQVAFTASSSRPMRISVQLREPAGDRWLRSVYLDGAPRPVTVRFDDMHPAEARSPAHPRLSNVNALLLVVDTVNTTPGERGFLSFGHVQLERLAATGAGR